MDKDLKDALDDLERVTGSAAKRAKMKVAALINDAEARALMAMPRNGWIALAAVALICLGVGYALGRG